MLKHVKTAVIAASLGVVALGGAAEAQTIYLTKNSAYERADKAMRAGELEQASKLFKRAVRGTLEGTQLVAAYNNLCAIDLALGSLESAEKACSGAIGENRLYWKAYVNRSHVRAAMGKTELALKDINKALELKPDSKLAKRVLARVQEQQRLFAEAK